jgi:hypothetical protein
VFDCRDNGILAHAVDWDGRVVPALHNFSDKPSQARIDSEMDEDVVEVADIWSDSNYEPVRNATVKLKPYGYRWLRVLRRGQELLL